MWFSVTLGTNIEGMQMILQHGNRGQMSGTSWNYTMFIVHSGTNNNTFHISTFFHLASFVMLLTCCDIICIPSKGCIHILQFLRIPDGGQELICVYCTSLLVILRLWNKHYALIIHKGWQFLLEMWRWQNVGLHNRSPNYHYLSIRWQNIDISRSHYITKSLRSSIILRFTRFWTHHLKPKCMVT